MIDGLRNIVHDPRRHEMYSGITRYFLKRRISSRTVPVANVITDWWMWMQEDRSLYRLTLQKLVAHWSGRYRRSTSTTVNEDTCIRRFCRFVVRRFVFESQYHSIGGGARLRNDLYCVEWDVKAYYTILYYTIGGGGSFYIDSLIVALFTVIIHRKKIHARLWKRAHVTPNSYTTA